MNGRERWVNVRHPLNMRSLVAVRTETIGKRPKRFRSPLFQDIEMFPNSLCIVPCQAQSTSLFVPIRLRGYLAIGRKSFGLPDRLIGLDPILRPPQ